jgi:hypothetical protein
MSDLRVLLERLTTSGLDFVVVGAYAAIIHGASVVTRDVDVCFKFNPENLYRLRDALADLHPVHRMTPKRLPLELNEENVQRLRNLYLETDLGSIDCLGEIIAVGDYDVVRSRSIVRKFAFGDVRILDIDALIATKSHMNRIQDKLVIPQLLAIKERQM